ncbi:MAG: hypothetical protein ACR2QM_02840 [Longimicrobiales bacterium]
MNRHRTTLMSLAVCALTMAFSACSELTRVPDPDSMRIEVQVSGGIAGVSYSFEVAGDDRVVRGLTCTSGCDFVTDQVLLPLSARQILDLVEQWNDTGILEMDGHDFGAPCCDDFEFVVTYSVDGDSATIEGSSQALPADMRAAVQGLMAMTQSVLPVVVDVDGTGAGFPRVPLTVGTVQLTGDLLEAELSFSGGCANHEIDLVAHGGWLESAPVQVNVFFSHDDNDDPCDAFPTETRTFDLRALARAYEGVYGVADPGTTTLLLRVEDAQETSGFRMVSYVF